MTVVRRLLGFRGEAGRGLVGTEAGRRDSAECR